MFEVLLVYAMENESYNSYQILLNSFIAVVEVFNWMLNSMNTPQDKVVKNHLFHKIFIISTENWLFTIEFDFTENVSVLSDCVSMESKFKQDYLYHISPPC